MIAVSRLLKSCAMPAVSWPTASIRCACRRLRPACFSAVTSAIAAQVRMKWPAASNSPREASRPSNTRPMAVTNWYSTTRVSPALASISGHACFR